MNRLTINEAEDFLWISFNAEPENTNEGEVEAYITDIDVETARKDWASYCAIMAREVDPDSIQITPDKVDGADMPCVKIIIKIGSHYAYPQEKALCPLARPQNDQ